MEDMEKFEVAFTEYGKVEGIHKKSVLGTDYIAFQGIPYMKAPLGKLRFRDAEEPNKWMGVLDAAEDVPSYCTRNMVTMEIEGQENAGIINVFTKKIKPEKLYPVMVWIHGGGFRFGSSKPEMYGPDYFLQKDVIFVSFNYRLGVFGFLSLEDESLNIPGNAGLKDQLFALKWIQRNIKNFGGDPNNVTLFGESAGAACVHFLSICEQAKGLFNRAVIMSGSAFCKTWALVPRDYTHKFANNLARSIGWNGKAGDDKDMLNFLEDAPAFEIMEAHTTLVSNHDIFSNHIMNAFAPVIEPYTSANCLIFKDPVEMAREAWSNDIDLIFTGTSLEGSVCGALRTEVAYYYLQNSAYFAPLRMLNIQHTDPIAEEYGERIKNLYFEEGQQPSPENRYQYLQYQSDAIIWHGMYRSIQSRIEFSQRNTYVLRFHVNGTLNLFKRVWKCEEYNDAGHGDDLFYLFKTIHLDSPSRDSKEFAAIEKMIGMLTSFAVNGDPNCKEIEPIKFNPQTDADNLMCIQITEDDVTEIELPELTKLKVWNSVYNDHDVPLY